MPTQMESEEKSMDTESKGEQPAAPTVGEKLLHLVWKAKVEEKIIAPKPKDKTIGNYINMYLNIQVVYNPCYNSCYRLSDISCFLSSPLLENANKTRYYGFACVYLGHYAHIRYDKMTFRDGYLLSVNC